MKKILDLAQSFQKNSEQEVKVIEQQVKNDLNELQTAIHLELKKSEQRIIEDIRKQDSKMRSAILESCHMTLMILIVALALLLLANFYLSKELRQTYTKHQKITQESEKLGYLMDKAKQFQECTTEQNKTYLCVAIHPNSSKWNINGLDYQLVMPLQPIQSKK